MKAKTNYKKPFISGIGGTGVSNIAYFFLESGIKVYGSDLRRNAVTEKLEKLGAEIYYEQNAQTIEKIMPDAFFYSQAVLGGDGKFELEKAEELKIPTFKNAEGYWELIGKDKKTVSIAGAHGKTTTTAITSLVFEAGGVDPVCISGAEIKEFGNSYKGGDGDYFVVESCEYREQFLAIEKPFATVILNIEHDHPDFYPDIEATKEAFYKFAGRTDPNGFLLAFAAERHTRSVASELEDTVGTKVYYYGEEDEDAPLPPDFKIVNVQEKGDEFGYTFDIVASAAVAENLREGFPVKLETSVPGRQNVWNAAAAYITFALLEPQKAKERTEQIYEAIKNYKGSHRRQEYIGEYIGVKVYDDYAHHPTQIEVTLDAFKTKFDKVAVLFEPHQYSRTRDLLEEFSKCFSSADKLFLFPIYKVPGRDTEEDIKSVSIEKLYDLLIAEGVNVELKNSSEDLKDILDEVYNQNYNVILNLGAGTLSNHLRELIKNES